MEYSAIFHLMAFYDEFFVASPGCSCDYVFIKRERDEDNDDKEIYSSAHSTHSFGSVKLALVW